MLSSASILGKRLSSSTSTPTGLLMLDTVQPKRVKLPDPEDSTEDHEDSVEDSVEEVTPVSNSNINWSKWISATSLRNYMLKEPLLDWLSEHYHTLPSDIREEAGLVIPRFTLGLGTSTGTTAKRQKLVDPLVTHLMQQGIEFEARVVELLREKMGVERVVTVCEGSSSGACDPIMAQETFESMKKGVPVIHGGVLHNHKNRTYGITDLLVRSDWLHHLVKVDPSSSGQATVNAPKLGNQKYHYVVVDIKYTTLNLKSDGTHLLNSGSIPAYKAQLWVYNKALGELQGYTPDKAYLLGRRIKYSKLDTVYEYNDCFYQLGTVNFQTKDYTYAVRAANAVTWLTQVRSPAAAKWNVHSGVLTRPELYPNMSNTMDFPWRPVKEILARRLGELTSLWMVGPAHRITGHANGVYQWSDPRCDPEMLGINGDKISHILNKVLEVNRQTKHKILPAKVANNLFNWQDECDGEFYVDFENTNTVFDDLHSLPRSTTRNTIFMIGVGHIVDDEWVYRSFTVDALDSDEEYRICLEFLQYINRNTPRGVTPKCFHWSQAETNVWCEVAERYPKLLKYKFQWCDLLKVFKYEPITIRGCMGFGLKEVTANMHRHGLIETNYDGCDMNGAMASVEAVKISKLTDEMSTHPEMLKIVKYNEVDVKVLQEILEYLRDYMI